LLKCRLIGRSDPETRVRYPLLQQVLAVALLIVLLLWIDFRQAGTRAILKKNCMTPEPYA